MVPSRILDCVKTLEINVLPMKARRREEWLKGQRYGLAGVMGEWLGENRKVEIWLYACWKTSLGIFSTSSWSFGAWNTFLYVLYHELGHAEDTALGLDFEDPRDRLGNSTQESIIRGAQSRKLTPTSYPVSFTSGLTL